MEEDRIEKIEASKVKQQGLDMKLDEIELGI